MHLQLAELESFLKSENMPRWGADSGGTPVGSVVAPARLALAVGNEGAGLSSSVREHVTQLVSLPISASVESLNVAVAAGILLYQLSK